MAAGVRLDTLDAAQKLRALELRVAYRARQADAERREEIAQSTVDAEALQQQYDRLKLRAECAGSFRVFLRHWRFVDRETGTVRTFADLWPGQAEFVTAMLHEPWIFALKAGKLGFTELECAYDAWVALYRQPNATVGIFSKDLTAAKKLLGYVKFGIQRLPEWLSLPFSDGPGSDTTQSIILRGGPDDVRRIISYAAKPTTAVDETLSHAHVDELSNMIDPEGVWGSVSTIVPDAPHGSLHIVTRGRGPRVYTAVLWEGCQNNGGNGKLYGFFASWRGRPRPEGWYERETDPAVRTRAAARWYAPETASDALAGDTSSQFVEPEQWDACEAPEFAPISYDATFEVNLAPGDKTPVVMALDAAVTRDYFAAVGVSRHPTLRDEVVLRFVRVWRPEDQPSHEIDFESVEKWIVATCRGRCARGHPFWREYKDPKCEACKLDAPSMPGYRVVQIPYDVYQLADMGQRLNRRKVAWCEEFGQMGPRLEADSDLRGLIAARRLHHGGSPILRRAALEAAAEYQRGELEQRKLRIVKLGPSSKIDPLVALSMAAKRCLYLNLGSGNPGTSP